MTNSRLDLMTGFQTKQDTALERFRETLSHIHGIERFVDDCRRIIGSENADAVQTVNAYVSQLESLVTHVNETSTCILEYVGCVPHDGDGVTVSGGSEAWHYDEIELCVDGFLVPAFSMSAFGKKLGVLLMN